jgi:IMP cyclohydrolase
LKREFAMKLIMNKAEMNLEVLRRNSYPGRGIVVGLDETGQYLVQVYWIMGRSANSRNRVFGYDKKEGRLFTEAADPSQVKDPSLIIYNAMRETKSHWVVSNGRQTDAVVDSREDFITTICGYAYEPDAPNFTSRVTATSTWSIVPSSDTPGVLISILRKSPWSDACDRHFYEINDLGKGFGYCVTTYRGDGDPLPAFQGEPYLLPLRGDARFIADYYWTEVLNGENKVALAVKFIPKSGPSEVTIRNKYEKVSWPLD